jgi:hypothetical protein
MDDNSIGVERIANSRSFSVLIRCQQADNAETSCEIKQNNNWHVLRIAG